MKERPIIFSTEMVRAILEGRKTQTRRVIKPQPTKGLLIGCYWEDGKPETAEWCLADKYGDPIDAKPLNCPYGPVGDRLWVKETFQTLGSKKNTVYRATGGAELTWNINGTTHRETLKKWRSPLFMPRWASRITLEITGLRVERLQDITEEDAVIEGLPPREQTGFDTARYRYHILWDSLNAKRGYAWESNPWVWVIEFKRLSD